MTDITSDSTNPARQEDEVSTANDFGQTIQLELERLNKSSSEINAFESRLEVERTSYAELFEQSQRETAALSEKLRKSIELARPYFEAKLVAKEANLQSQKAAWRFERARSVEEAAKEMVNIAEQAYFTKRETFGAEWQETLNTALVKVNDAEKERITVEGEHHLAMLAYSEAEQRASELRRTLRKHVERAEKYFNAVERFGEELSDRKSAIERLERDVALRKREYAGALRHLELISNELHRLRGEAGACVPRRNEDNVTKQTDTADRSEPSSKLPVTGDETFRSDSLTSLSTTSSIVSAVNQQSTVAKCGADQYSKSKPECNEAAELRLKSTTRSNGFQCEEESQSRERTDSDDKKVDDNSLRLAETNSTCSLTNRPSSAGSASSTRSNTSTKPRSNLDAGCKLHLPTVDLLKTSLQHASLSYVSYEQRVAFERQLFAPASSYRLESTESDSKHRIDAQLADGQTVKPTSGNANATCSSSRNAHPAGTRQFQNRL